MTKVVTVEDSRNEKLNTLTWKKKSISCLTLDYHYFCYDNLNFIVSISKHEWRPKTQPFHNKTKNKKKIHKNNN